MYADDVVIISHGKTPKEAAQVLTTVLTRIQAWLLDSCLLVDTKKKVCMLFSKKPVEAGRSNVFLGREELELVKQFNYLGVTLDPNLKFKIHIRKDANTIKFSLQNFKQFV